MPDLNAVQRAAELHKRGLGPSEIAAELGVSRSTVQRWRAAYPERFERHEPGSLEHRRAILLRAAETGSLTEQLRAVELLEKLDAGSGAKGPGLVRVYVAPRSVCPHCGETIEGESRVVRPGDVATEENES